MLPPVSLNVAQFGRLRDEMLRRIARAVGRSAPAGALTSPASRQSAIKEEYRGAYEACRSKKASVGIEPFLRLLYDNGLIDCGGNPRASDLKTRIKIQKFVYFAQSCFGMSFDYRHTLYIYGPYSPTLANDYFRIRDIKDVPPGEPDSWARVEEFLDFAKGHNDVDWLEIASTLLYLHKTRGVAAERLAESAERIKYKFQASQIRGVCKELQRAGFVK